MCKTNGFHNVIDDQGSLDLFIKKVAEFDAAFCELMMKGGEFTLRLDVHGNRGEIIHIRVFTDDIERPVRKSCKKTNDVL